jgi:hypothetical protein
MAAMIYRIILGMDFTTDGIKFAPMVPAALNGEKTLTNFKYRDANITVKVIGTGEQIKSFTINGVASDNHFLPADTKGDVNIVITMDGKRPAKSEINNQPQQWMPATPIINWTGEDHGTIANYHVGIAYNITVNSNFLQQTTTPSVTFVPQGVYSLMDVVPMEQETWSGYTNRPFEYIPVHALTTVPAAMMGKTGTPLIKNPDMASRFIETSRSLNQRIDFDVTVNTPGDYFLDVRYANGCGPINTSNMCAIRMLYINDAEAGPIVMPQRGIDEWLSTGFSNMLAVKLKEGVNHISLRYEIDNMNGDVNTALIEYMRIIKQ